MRNTLSLLFLMLISLNTSAQENFSTLEEQMTGKEFSATGLGKLTQTELEALNEWLRAHSVATLEEARGPYTDSRGFELQSMKNMDESTIVSRVMGRFSGWDGDTIFELENGMIWKQDEGSTWYMNPQDNPVVTIEKGMFGSWRLSVEGYNRTVDVERIQ